MKISKSFIENWQQGKGEKKENFSHPSDPFIYQLMKQGKQLSQLVARSWMGDEIALQLKNIFIDPRGDDGSADGKLKQLLGDDGTGEFRELLLSIFHDYELPIFSEYELTKVYSFSISWETWEGSLEDIKQPWIDQGQGKNFYFNIVIPYPPRPELGESTITLGQLEDWVAQDVTDEQGALLIGEHDGKTYTVFPPYPYIPPTSC